MRPAIGLEVLAGDEALVVTPGIGHREMVAAEHPVQDHQDAGRLAGLTPARGIIL